MKIRLLSFIMLTLLALSVHAQQVVNLTTGSSGAPGANDPYWSVKLPFGTTFNPVKISTGFHLAGTGAVVTNLYVKDNCGQWISPHISSANHISLNGYQIGNYIYQRTFVADDCEVQSATLDLDFIAVDNQILSYSINGNLHSPPPGTGFVIPRTLLATIPANEIIRGGVNVIEVTVRNNSNYCALQLCGSLTINSVCCNLAPSFMTGSAKDCGAFQFDNTSTATPGLALSYLWDFGDGTTSTNISPNHFYRYNGNYTVTLTMYGTGPEGQCCVEKITQKITVDCKCHFNLSMDISLDDDCGVVHFNGYNDEIGTMHNVAFHWDFGDGTVYTGQNPTHTYTENGVYPVSLTVMGYNGTECCRSEPIRKEVVIDCIPKDCNIHPMFSYTINSNTVHFSNSTLTDPGTLIVGYLWDFGDGTTSTDANPSHTYTPNINHPVRLTVTAFRGDKCCTEEILVFVSQATKKDDNPGSKNNLKVVPNPNNGEFLLVSKANLTSDVEYQIVAYETGKVVLTGVIEAKSKDPVNLSHVPAGIYIVIYNIDGIWENERFIIE